MSNDCKNFDQIYNNGNLDYITLRKHYEQDQLHKEFKFVQIQNKNVSQELLQKAKTCNITKCLASFFPIFGWISTYSPKNDLVPDLIAGCTVAVMHIPQGMAYALLGNVPPIVGIYMAFFPVLLYLVFGTSKHNSMGTFAVVTIMVGKIVDTYSADTSYQKPPNHQNVSTNNLDPLSIPTSANVYDPVSVAVAVCFAVGVIQLMMFVMRLGIVSSLLSEALVSGLTTGAAIHVLTSQIKDLFGLSFKKSPGHFEVINTYINIFGNISKLNWIATGISAITIIFLVFNNEVLKKYVGKKCSFPIPAELILVLSGTLLSHYLSLRAYSVKTLKHIPTGLPDFKPPDFNLVQQVAVESIPIAMVSYAVSISMALIFAQKRNYNVDANQELFAMGISNVFGSCFSCMPFSASLSRSVIQFNVGGKTQIASLVSCGILVFILLWIGPFFEPLPRCVLAGIIVVSLKGMLKQITQFLDFWKLNRLDAIVWIITFLTVVLIAIDIGLIVGIVSSLICILIGSMKPYVCLLGHTNANLYLDINRFKAAIELPQIKIFRYCGSINFATKNIFKNSLTSLLQFNLSDEIQKSKKTEASNKGIIEISSFNLVILDLSALTYIDPSGVKFLKNLINDFNSLYIQVLISGVSCPVYDTMVKCTPDDTKTFKFFPTIDDAVSYYNTSTTYI